MRVAEAVLQVLDDRKIIDMEIWVDWAYQRSKNEDTTSRYSALVGCLGPEVNDDNLVATVSSLSATRPMPSGQSLPWMANGSVFVLSESTGQSEDPRRSGHGTLSYESVLHQTPTQHSTVYVGNLAPYTTQVELIPFFRPGNDTFKCG